MNKEHYNLVKKIALHVQATAHSSVLLDDLIQSGVVGFLEAEKRYTEEGGASFNTFVGKRIKGEMLDSLRKVDWSTRTINKNRRLINTTRNKLESSLLRPVRDREVAEALNISMTEYFNMTTDIHNAQLSSLDVVIGDDIGESGGGMESFINTISGDADVLQEGICDEGREALLEGLHSLSDKENNIITLYYKDELTLREIALELGVSEGRVSQLLKGIVGVLRRKVNAGTN